MPLRVARRKDTGALVFTGTIAGRRIRESAGTDNPRTARELCALREAELLKGHYLGQRATKVTFEQAVVAYLQAWPQKRRTQDYLKRLLPELRGRLLTTITQADANAIRDRILGPDARPATFMRAIITPLRAVLRFAADPVRDWCEPPRLGLPKGRKIGKGRTVWITPERATALVDAAADHLAPLLVFLFCHGARLAEATELEWDHVDLRAGTCTLGLLDARGTKNGDVRQLRLVPRAIAALASLPHRTGRVFLHPVWRRGATAPELVPFADNERQQGGQIRKSFATACRKAGITGLTPHGCRHTWASWHYAVHRNLIRLRDDGCWSSVELVERYAHDVPDQLAAQVRTWWGMAAAGQDRRVG